ncbi:penicillin amidase [Aliidongia dinghuensis]|uniref:Penicillin amidase n=1 Tax=Aliidongia dinghuensis TaxID=1867774 RepID=A0A8J2Z0G3_9PROT|nr:penicillin acylase family protein [Aliidongia dinghuensis]GGF39519.1 penicillin amidase [Aliidongia dinghuensis]
MRLRTILGFLRFGAHLEFRAPRPAAPGTIDLAARLAMLPTRGLPVMSPVEIHWNDRQVPFIEAASDRDLAVALGLVHAHLRLGQMELMRRITYGRIAEMIGPAGIELDRTLRILDLPRAVPAIEAGLPGETGEWLAGFVAGINHYLAEAPALPHEFALFGLAREPWRVADVLALGRLAGADFMWLVWRRLLPALNAPEGADLWRRLVAIGATPIIPDGATGPLEAAATEAALGINNRSGSNSFAIAGQRTGREAAWIASDPHLGLSLPNTWLMAGYRSPGHQAVGLMIPGVPFIALGRNPRVAWGGTNLHAFASELVDVTDIDPGQIAERTSEIAVRWGRQHRLALRESPAGPVLSDSPFFDFGGRRVALRWVGHGVSDEFTAMLRVNRARSWTEFKDGLASFAIPGQNMIYAGSEGDIGHVLAAHVPADAEPMSAHPIRRDGNGWDHLLTSAELPAWHDPPTGYVVSANDRPAAPAPVVGHLFSSDDRRDRIRALIEAVPQLTFETLAAFQQDVTVPSAGRLAHKLAAAARSGGRQPTPRQQSLLAALEGWDGRYEAGSAGAAAFEQMLFHFARAFYAPRVLAAYSAAWTLRDLILLDLETVPRPQLERAAWVALVRVARSRLRGWGDVHRLRLRHPLGALPVLLGRRYRYFDLPAGGSSETVMKTAHGLASGRHAVRYGSNARHISDLADLDQNHFVLLGGQDGWFGSTTFTDQVTLWRAGAYVQIPLRPETVKRLYPHSTRVEPHPAAGGG